MVKEMLLVCLLLLASLADASYSREVSRSGQKNLSRMTSPSLRRLSIVNPTKKDDDIVAKKDDDSSTAKTSSSTSKSSTSSQTKPAKLSNATTTKPMNATKTNTTSTATAFNSNTTASTTNATVSQNTKGPVVDDVLQFLDDDHVRNSTKLLPPEKAQPASWPMDVFGIFLGAAVLLFIATAFKNYRKRRTYSSVPTATATMNV